MHVKTSYISHMHRAPAPFDLLIHSPLLPPLCLVIAIMSLLLMITLDALGFILLKLNMMTSFAVFVMIMGEYNSNNFCSQLNEKGILQQLSCVYTPVQNGIVERKNRQLMSTIWCLLRGTNVPKTFQHLAILPATYLVNHTPSRILSGKASLNVLHPTTTLFPILPRVFGCTCFVQNRCPSQTKLDDKAIHCIFLGYFSVSKGYRWYNHVTCHTYYSKGVTFSEYTPCFGTNPLQTLVSSSPLILPISVFDFPVEVSTTPPSFQAKGEYNGKVCRLEKSLYSLKQSPRA